jgi:hypothetical protein
MIIPTETASEHLHHRATSPPRLRDNPYPERRLAMSVLLQAWKDLTSSWQPWHHNSALAFFADTAALEPWCWLAGLDPLVVQGTVQAALQDHPAQPRRARSLFSALERETL